MAIIALADLGHQIPRGEIDYAEARNIPLKINRETNYSKDKTSGICRTKG